MRSVTAGETTVLQSRVRAVRLKVEVQDSGGSYVDLSQYAPGATVDVDVDAPVHQATVTFVRASGSTKFSPLLASTLDLSRGVKISASVTAPAAADNYKLLFAGYVTGVEWQRDPLRFTARGTPGGRLAERWVEVETVYGAAVGTPVQDVMGDIVDEWSDEALVTPVAPGFNVNKYRQARMSVWDALAALAGLPGWTVRERINAAGTAFEARFEEPDRAITTEMWTFTADDVLDVQRMAMDRDPLRNVVWVSYPDATTGTRALVIAEEPSSIAADGRLFMELELADDSPIDTLAEANALALAALSDLSQPPAAFEYSVPLFWPIELDDYYAFGALTDLFPATQRWAVSGYTHDIPAEPGGMAVTRARVRGKPQGFWRQWLELAGVPHPVLPLGFLSVEYTADPSGVGVVIARVTDSILSVTAHAKVGDDPDDEEILTYGIHKATVGLSSGRTVTIAGLGRGDVGDVLHLGLIGWSDEEGEGERTDTAYARAAVLARPASAAPSFAVSHEIVGGASHEVTVALVSDPDDTMKPYGADSFVRFTNLDTGAVLLELDTPAEGGGLPRPEYRLTIASTATVNLRMEAIWRRAEGDYPTLHIEDRLIEADTVARMGRITADWLYDGHVGFTFNYNQNFDHARFLWRRTGPYTQADVATAIASGTTIPATALQNWTEYETAEPNPEFGGTIYWIGVPRTAANVAGPAVIGSRKREQAEGELAFLDVRLEEVRDPDTGAVVRPRGAPQLHWGGKGPKSFRVKMSKLAAIDEDDITDSIILSPTSSPTSITIDGVAYDIETVFADAFVGGGKPIKSGVLNFADPILLGEYDKLYVRVWFHGTADALKEPGLSLERTVLGPNFIGDTVQLDEWTEAASRLIVNSGDEIASLQLDLKGIQPGQYLDAQLAVEQARVSGNYEDADVTLQLVYHDLANAQIGSVFDITVPFDDATWPSRRGQKIITLPAHQVPAGAVRVRAIVSTDNETGDFPLWRRDFRLRVRPDPATAARSVSFQAYIDALTAGAAAGSALQGEQSTRQGETTDETGQMVRAGPLFTADGAVQVVTADGEADELAYPTTGTPLKNLEPAQPGADVTGANTALNTNNVGPRTAAQVNTAVDEGLGSIVAPMVGSLISYGNSADHNYLAAAPTGVPDAPLTDLDAGEIIWLPFSVPVSRVLDSIRIAVDSAAGSVNFGVYDNVLQSYDPNARLYHTPSPLAWSSSPSSVTDSGIGLALIANRVYWLAIEVPSGTIPTWDRIVPFTTAGSFGANPWIGDVPALTAFTYPDVRLTFEE